MSPTKPESWRSLDATDVLAIHELLARYGHVIDERDWAQAEALFVPDARYDMSDFGLDAVCGARAIRALWVGQGEKHPLAHHATNIVVSEAPDGTVRVLSKGLGIGRRGRAGSVTYRDVVQHTPDGWRFAERVGVLRRAPLTAAERA